MAATRVCHKFQKRALSFTVLQLAKLSAVFGFPGVRLSNRTHHGVILSGVLLTRETDSAVSYSPWRQTQRCPAHRGDRLSGALLTVETGSAA